MSDKKFVDGLYYKSPHESAPDFVIGELSIQKDKLMGWLHANEANDKGYINLQIKRSKEGKMYIEINDWKPKEKVRF